MTREREREREREECVRRTDKTAQFNPNRRHVSSFRQLENRTAESFGDCREGIW